MTVEERVKAALGAWAAGLVEETLDEVVLALVRDAVAQDRHECANAAFEHCLAMGTSIAAAIRERATP